MKFFRSNRKGDNQTHKSARPPRSLQSEVPSAFEPLEGRQLFSVTGFSLVNEASFPGAPTTVTNQPTIFQSTLQKSWQELIAGQLKINGQTLGQTIASGIQSAEEAQGLSAYNISSGFDGTPTYNGTLKQTSSGSELVLTFDAIGNETTFTSTTNSIFGSWADPTFHVTYNLNLTIDLMLPSNLVTGKVTASALATTSDVTVSTSNVLVGIADFFGNNIPLKIAEGINGQKANISSVVPTGLLNTALQLEAAQGYTHLLSSLNSSGNLVLTAEKSSLTVNGARNDSISISAGSDGAVVVAAGGQTQTFAPGYLKSITVNDNGLGKNTVDIPTLPSGVTVQVNDNSIASDTVTVGNGTLSSVGGTVNVDNTSSLTALTVDDWSDTSTAALTVTKNAVELSGRSVVTYATSGYWASTTLTVQAGRKNTVAINSSSTPVTISSLGASVTVGDGSLSTIGGAVSLDNFGTVVIDDYNDTTGRTVDLSGSTSGIFTSSTVAFKGFSIIQLGYVSGVTISDGSGDNAYDAESSPSNDFFTIEGHFGDTLTGPAASQVDLNLFSRIAVPITPPVHL